MKLIINAKDISRLRPETREDLFSTLFNEHFEVGVVVEGDPEYDWEEVEELSVSQIRKFASGCSDKTLAGLRVFAEHGPVIDAKLLKSAEITSYSNFQAGLTKRVRTITGNKKAFFLTWDEWDEYDGDGVGHYAVPFKTHSSLRQYFDMD